MKMSEISQQLLGNIRKLRSSKCFTFRTKNLLWTLLLLFLFASLVTLMISSQSPVLNTTRRVDTDIRNLFKDDVQIYWEQNRRNRHVSEIGCKSVLLGDNRTISSAKSYMKIHQRSVLNDFIYFNLTKNCTDFKLKRGYVTKPLSAEAANFSLAYSILFYKDLEQVERLLRAIYRPNNIYCLHLDAYSSDVLLRATQALVSCFDNVFLASKLEKVIYASYSRLQADINCMEDLLRKETSWKYLINLASQMFPLKTNEEIVEILKLYNGSNIISSLYGDNVRPRRFKYKIYYEKPEIPGAKPKIKKGHQIPNPPPPHNITILKGSAYGVFSRKMIEFVLLDKRCQDFLSWSRDTFTPDEHFWASINSLKFNPHLKTPGGNHADPHRTLSIAVYVGWKEKNCMSGKLVRWICIFGLQDLPRMISPPTLFANKFYLDFEYLALDCLEEYLWNKTWSPIEINRPYYQRIAQLQLHGDPTE